MTKWLTAEQQAYWRAYLTATALLQDRLSRELQEAHGISLSDYEILVRLSESPERRMRMSTLADRTCSSRSRLSHQVDRLEGLSLVVRQACETDRRGSNAVLTDTGMDLLVTAAPTHVAGVRQHMVDCLPEEQFRALGEACEAMVEGLRTTAAMDAPSA